MLAGVLTTSYPRFPGDGAGSFVRDRVAALRESGFEVEVLAAGDRGAATAGDIEADGDGVTVERLGAAAAHRVGLFYRAGAPEVLERGGWPVWAAALGFSVALARRAHARRARWALVESHWLVPCGLLGATQLGDLPHRAFAHSGDVALLERLPGGAGAALARIMAGSGADLVFVSCDLQARFARLCGRRVGRIEHLAPPAALFRPPSVAERAEARAARGLGPGERLVLGVGRLVPIKGWDVLVEAVASLPTRVRPRLAILGEGPTRQALAARAVRADVDLVLPGSLPRPEIPRWCWAADLAVQPSRALPGGRTEGLPLGALEALAGGLPLVASASGGLAELGGRPGVRLVRPDDPIALAAALTAMLDRGTGLRSSLRTDFRVSA